MRVAVPEWIKVLPAGTFKGRDGRGPFKNTDPAKIIANTNLFPTVEAMTIDYDHAADFAPNGGGEPAGWFKELQISDGAIFARIEWTEKGRQAVDAKEYCYISPVFTFDEKTGEVLQLLRAGLTNSPNLYGTAICGRERWRSMSPFQSINKGRG